MDHEAPNEVFVQNFEDSKFFVKVHSSLQFVTIAMVLLLFLFLVIKGF